MTENLKDGGKVKMAKYLARQIKNGKLDYGEVVEKYPQFKNDIDALLGQ